MTPRPSVLFVCVHNAGRSQMAAGYLRHLAGDKIEVLSAGSAPKDSINPQVVEAMREEGIDLAGQQPKILTDDAVRLSDVVITMGCGDACPYFPGKRYLDWKLDDPAGQGLGVRSFWRILHLTCPLIHQWRLRMPSITSVRASETLQFCPSATESQGIPHGTGVPRPKRKTKAEDLARARNNQRKSRERKKHHVAELEQKVKQLESAAAAMAEVSMPSMSLVNENRILRRLLESIGYDSGSLEGYLQAPQQSFVDSNYMVPAASTPGVGFVGLELGSTPTDQLAAEEASSSFQTADLIHPATLDFSYSAPTLGAEEVSLDILQGQGPTWNAGFSITQDLAGVLHTMDGETSRSASSVNGETTLCSVAFHLIVQCNLTGKDVLKVETKLRYGYKMPAGPGEGCRVDNRTLLAVLAELVSETGMGPIT